MYKIVLFMQPTVSTGCGRIIGSPNVSALRGARSAKICLTPNVKVKPKLPFNYEISYNVNKDNLFRVSGRFELSGVNCGCQKIKRFSNRSLTCDKILCLDTFIPSGTRCNILHTTEHQTCVSVTNEQTYVLVILYNNIIMQGNVNVISKEPVTL